MLIIEVKEDESIDRALKRFKRKFRNTKMREQIYKKKEYVKPSQARRNELLKSIYQKEKEKELEMA